MSKHRTTRFFRISIFVPGVALATMPLKHFACKKAERAELLFEQWRGKIGTDYKGQMVGRVVVHEGNLKYASYRILSDATEQKDAVIRIKQDLFRITVGTLVEVPEWMYRPREVAADAFAEVVESWAGGLQALRFVGSDTVVDYTAEEARKWRVTRAL